MTLKFKVFAPAALCFALTVGATAQSDALRALYEASATIPTNMEGIRTFPAPPAGFNAITASDEELAHYGIPFRPDKATDPDGYRAWARAMSVPTKRWYGELKAPRAHSGPPRIVSAYAAVPGTAPAASTLTTTNWSGVINTLPLTTYSKTQSFCCVAATFNVPIAQQAFSSSGGNVCNGFWDGTDLFVGQDGLNQNHVFVGGVQISAFCDQGEAHSTYYAWAEWSPTTGATMFSVNPGDDIYVSANNTSSTSGVVFIEDLTTLQSASMTLKPTLSKYALIANQAEYIVERPNGDPVTGGLFPLANYVDSFWDFARAKTYSKVYYYPGSTASSTIDLTMTDDSGADIISVINVGSSGFQGNESIEFSAASCAVVNGCP
jgi:hypothetical protein